MSPEYRVLRAGAVLPPPPCVQELFVMASGDFGVDTITLADRFADLYERATTRFDLVAVDVRQGEEVVGFCYGFRWWWDEQRDDWALDLLESLGPEASLFDGSFLIGLVVVHPMFNQQGIGSEMVELLMNATGVATHWLTIGEEDATAARLFSRLGFTELAAGTNGPVAADGILLLHQHAG